MTEQFVINAFVRWSDILSKRSMGKNEYRGLYNKTSTDIFIIVKQGSDER